jgi:hypothetical protein
VFITLWSSSFKISESFGIDVGAEPPDSNVSLFCLSMYAEKIESKQTIINEAINILKKYLNIFTIYLQKNISKINLMSIPMKQPIVFLLDFDGTMQGNIQPQIKEYTLISEMNKIILNKKKIKYNNQYLQRDILNGLIRPDLKKSLQQIKQKHSNVEFFIYTASQDEWANFILPKFCEYLNDKQPLINKPFFTRKHCINNGTMKSIRKIKKEVQSALHYKYNKKKDSKLEIESIYLVDNNYVLQEQEFSHLIYCPTYEYKMSIDLIRNLEKEIVMKYYKQISQLLFDDDLQVNSYIEFLYKYYENLYNNILIDTKLNQKQLKDNYWSLFANIVTSYELTHKANVVKMAKKLNSIK